MKKLFLIMVLLILVLPMAFGTEFLYKSHIGTTDFDGNTITITDLATAHNMTSFGVSNAQYLTKGDYTTLVGANSRIKYDFDRNFTWARFEGIAIWEDPTGGNENSGMIFGFRPTGFGTADFRIFGIGIEDNVAPVVRYFANDGGAGSCNTEVATGSWNDNDVINFSIEINTTADTMTTILNGTTDTCTEVTRDWDSVDGLYLMREVAGHNASVADMRLYVQAEELGITIEDTDAPAITINSPANNTKINTFPTSTIDISVTDASPVTCTLSNSSTIFSTSSGGSHDYFLNWTTTDIEQSYDMNVTCIDDLNNSKTELLTITVDTIQPFITINSPVNNTVHKDIPLDITAFDDNIFILNVTLFNGTGVHFEIENNTNISTPDNGILSILNSIDTSSLADGSYTLNVTASDSHTRRGIDDYGVFPIGNAGFQYVTPEGNDVQITKIGAPIDSPVTYKNVDRYNFDYGVTPTRETHTFKVQSSGSKIEIMNTGIKGHLVLWNGVNGNWIDFENGDDGSTVDVIRITDKLVDVIVTSNNFNFRSIGGLNIEYLFHVVTVDNTVPTSVSTVISDSEPVEGDIIQINHTCSDINGIISIAVANNVTTPINVSTISFGNITPATAIFNHTAVPGFINTEFTCIDSVGNSIQSSINYNASALPPGAEVTGTEGLASATVSFLIAMIIIITLVMVAGFFVKGKGGKKR